MNNLKSLTVLVILSFFISTSANSQVIVDGVNINDLDEVIYCQVIATGKMFSKKVTINIDYGQESKFFGKQNSKVKGIDNKPVKFNSLFAAINHMASNGWVFIHAYPVIVGNSNVYHYTFEKDGSF